MNWTKEYIVPQFYNYLFWSLPLLAIIFLWTKSALLFSLFFLFIMFIFLNNYYLNYSYENLKIPGKKISVRMFPDDQGVIQLLIENYSKLPIPHGEVTVYLHDSDKSIKVLDQPENKEGIYSYFVSLLGSQRLTKEIKVKAKKRGIVQIRSIQFTMLDLLKLGKQRLSYRGDYRAEVIVYPLLTQVTGLKQMIQLQQGNKPKNHALYEDVMLAMGTRDYDHGDPFNKINWKATARTNSLQTKVFETTTVSKWCIMVNIQCEQQKYHTVENLEQVLSNVAFTCQFATINNISFELYINSKKPMAPFVHLPVGNGKDHLLKALEILARLRKDNVLTNSTEMISHAKSSHIEETSVIHFGLLKDYDLVLYNEWKTKGAMIFYVHTETESAKLLPIGGVNGEKMAT